MSGILAVTRDEDLLKLDMPAAPVEPADLPELPKALGVDAPTFLSREGNGNTIVLLESEAALMCPLSECATESAHSHISTCSLSPVTRKLSPFLVAPIFPISLRSQSLFM